MKTESEIRAKVDAMQKTSSGAFLAHLIDYAGLFPPASLSLETAIRNYAAYRTGGDAWMLGRFIISASRLNELEPYVPLFSSKMPLAISVVGSKSTNTTDCLKGLQNDLAQVTRFRDRYGDTIEIGVFEMPLPPVPPMRELLHIIAKETAAYGLYTFCEVTVSLEEDWEYHMMDTLDAIAAHNAVGDPVLGFKLRAGGVTADMFPTPEQVTAALLGCRDRGIAMKFTAGLHHPIRMHRDEVHTRMHGFVNVFAAGMLAHVHNLDALTTAKILADEVPTNFSFTPKRLAWCNLMVSVDEIIQLRKEMLCSYGSCSFDEPRDDLRTLHIL
jgi:hypothetical protein